MIMIEGGFLSIKSPAIILDGMVTRNGGRFNVEDEVIDPAIRNPPPDALTSLPPARCVRTWGLVVPTPMAG